MSFVSCHPLTDKDLPELLRSCKQLPAKWEKLGVLLGISMDTIEAIRKAHLNDPDDCLMYLFTKWLKIVLEPTWRVLYEAIKEIPDLQLSQSLAKKHSCNCKLCSASATQPAVHIANSESVSKPVRHSVTNTEDLLAENEKLKKRIQEMEKAQLVEKERTEAKLAERDSWISFMREQLSRTRDHYCNNTGGFKRQLSEDDLQQHGKLLLEKAKAGDVDEVSNLVLRGTDINYTDQDDRTPLHVASKAGHTDVVRVLLTHGAKVDVKDKKDLTPLHLASMNGHSEIVNVLLSYGTKAVNMKEKEELRTPLHYAAIRGHTKVAQELLVNNASPSMKADRNQTPLHRASENGHVEIVRLLIEYKADIKAKNRYGNTPLHLASRKGATEIIKLLTESCQADIDDLNEEFRSPLHEACERGQTEVVKLLMTSYNASIEVKDQYGQSPLHTALLQGHIDTAMMLLSAGADINMKDKYGQTPVCVAVVLKLHDVLKFFQAKLTIDDIQRHELPPYTWEALLEDDKTRIIYRNKTTNERQYEHPMHQ